MLYDSKSCSNSTYWASFNVVQVVLLLLAFFAFVVSVIFLIDYLRTKKSKPATSKKFKSALIISLITMAILFVGSLGVRFYIDSQTKDLGYCWGTK